MNEYTANQILAHQRNRLIYAQSNTSREALERARAAIKRKRSFKSRILNIIKSIAA